MNAPALIPAERLPELINRAASALDAARDSAEVLEARDMARVAYDAAKSAARLLRAKQAHDTLIAEVNRAQAHALAIESRAKFRLADEIDAARDRDELATEGRPKTVTDGNGFQKPTTADLGLTRKDVHEARQLRDAARADPTLIYRTLNGMIERGEEPTRAALKREILQPKPKERVSDRALWVWGRLKDFERDGYLRAGPDALLSEMTEPMRADVRRLAPIVAAFITEIGDLS